MIRDAADPIGTGPHCGRAEGPPGARLDPSGRQWRFFVVGEIIRGGGVSSEDSDTDAAVAAEHK